MTDYTCVCTTSLSIQIVVRARDLGTPVPRVIKERAAVTVRVQRNRK